ncbi:MAG: hypothetical protein KJS73_04720 [Gammaproteobacteria bacterium]|jgi:hypothetical protein|nr:hypothetical protein [Gammaproteobacteria bacterium]
MRSRLGLRLCVVVLFAALGLQARAESVTGAQRQAASDYLLAVSSTDLQAVAYAIHPAELDRLRFGVLQKLREESARGGNAIRERLFGSAMPLSDVERLTSANLFRAVARRWSPHVRTHDSLEGLSATREGERVHVLVKQRPSKEGGRIETLEVVTLLAYGREWRAALPPEFEALVDDLVSGRQSRAVVAQTPSTIDTPLVLRSSTQALERNPPEIVSMLEAAEKVLVDGRCDRYYKEFLTPELQRGLAGRTMDSLISSCRRSMASRELLIAALRIVKRTSATIDNGGNRAVYDVTGQGLPFDRYVLERVEGRWYVAE